MGLNDSFSQIRGQLLLIDPLPPINKVFSLVSQKERQRNVSHVGSEGVDLNNGLAFLACNDNGHKWTGYDNSKRVGYDAQFSNNNIGPKKKRPFCTHCNFPGHTIEKCYKLHGYPPGCIPEYKSKSKPQTSQNVDVNQVSGQSAFDDKVDQNTGSIDGFIKTLNTS